MATTTKGDNAMNYNTVMQGLLDAGQTKAHTDYIVGMFYQQVYNYKRITADLIQALESTRRDCERAINSLNMNHTVSATGVLTSAVADATRLCAERAAAEAAITNTRFLINSLTCGAVQITLDECIA